jgi:hypothetical protein
MMPEPPRLTPLELALREEQKAVKKVYSLQHEVVTELEQVKMMLQERLEILPSCLASASADLDDIDDTDRQILNEMDFIRELLEIIKT